MSRGDGSLSDLGDGRYRIVFDLAPELVRDAAGTYRKKRRQKTVTFRATSLTEARKQSRLILAQRDTGGLIDPSTLLFGEWLLRWLDMHLHVKTHSTNTIRIYTGVVNHNLIPVLGSIRLRDLTKEDIQKYYNTSSLAPATLLQHHAVIIMALNAAVEDELIPLNPALRIRNKPKLDQESSSKDNYWTGEQVQTFFAYMYDHEPDALQDITLYAFTLDTGVRASEALGLQKRYVKLEESSVHIRQKLENARARTAREMFGPLKTYNPRRIIMSEGTVELLRKHFARQAELRLAVGKYYHDYDLVFAREGLKMGRPLEKTDLARKLKMYAVRAGIKVITFHGLRHTCATLLLSENENPKTVQDRLGHKNIKITYDVYAHVMPSMQESAAVKIGSILYKR